MFPLTKRGFFCAYMSSEIYQPGGQWNVDSSKQLLAFDVSLYSPTTSREAIIKDSVGLITEKVSAEKDFDTKTQVMLQLTPPEHEYIVDDSSGIPQLTCPEYFGTGKTLRDGLTSWRRGLDIRAMTEVQSRFFSPDTEIGTKFIWCSPRSEEWEEEKVKKYNGKYGYMYVGEVVEQVIEDKRVRKLVVHDFKTDLKTASYHHFLMNNADEIHYTPSVENPDEPFLDRVMASVAKINSDKSASYTDQTVWRGLSSSKKSVEQDHTLFGLDPETIIAFQNRELHKHIEQTAATEIADWILEEQAKGTPTYLIQSQIRNQFMRVTKRALTEAKYGKYLSVGVDKYRGSLIDLRGFKSVGGDFCGSWGGETRAASINFGPNINRSKNKCEGCKKEKEAKELGGCGYCKDCSD